MKQAQKQAYAKHRSNIANSRFGKKNRNFIKSRKKNSSDILLIHGDHDDIVSSNHLLEAKDFFIRNNVSVETHLIKNSGHHIPIEASSIALNYILKKFNDC